jgi:hypothetical protein
MEKTYSGTEQNMSEKQGKGQIKNKRLNIYHTYSQVNI